MADLRGVAMIRMISMSGMTVVVAHALAVGAAACTVESGAAAPTVTATARQAMRMIGEVFTMRTPTMNFKRTGVIGDSVGACRMVEKGRSHVTRLRQPPRTGPGGRDEPPRRRPVSWTDASAGRAPRGRRPSGRMAQAFFEQMNSA